MTKSTHWMTGFDLALLLWDGPYPANSSLKGWRKLQLASAALTPPLHAVVTLVLLLSASLQFFAKLKHTWNQVSCHLSKLFLSAKSSAIIHHFVFCTCTKPYLIPKVKLEITSNFRHMHHQFLCYTVMLILKTIGNRKRDCAWGCGGVKKSKKNQLLSTNHQNPYLLRLVMICAQQLIFLQFFNTPASSRTISFSISNSFWY